VPNLPFPKPDVRNCFKSPTRQVDSPQRVVYKGQHPPLCPLPTWDARHSAEFRPTAMHHSVTPVISHILSRACPKLTIKPFAKTCPLNRGQFVLARTQGPACESRPESSKLP
jgi:hypothetical protein